MNALNLCVTVLYHDEHDIIGSRELLALDDDGRDLVLPSPDGEPQVVARLTVVDDEVWLAAAPGRRLLVESAAVTRTTLGADRLLHGVLVRVDDHGLLLLRTPPLVVTPSYGGLLGESPEMHALRREVQRVARHDVPVLILGESGTGKELVAAAIHAHSARANKPLVRVNMAAIPESMAAGELFGHSRGAFTGATSASAGYFGVADGGSVFLDEIGDAPHAIQVALLRVLSFGEVQRVGENRPVDVDVRILAATDADLRDQVVRGEMRLPLLMRLGGYEIRIAPLRERREDVAVLLLSFLRHMLVEARAQHRLHRAANGGPWLSIELFEQALAHDWPGNVRELKNLAQRVAIAFADRTRVGDVSRSLRNDLPATVPPEDAPPRSTRRSLDDIEARELEDALERHDYRPSHTARALGISRTSLYLLIARHATLQKAADLDRPTIENALASVEGDVATAARSLAVSERGMRLRMRVLKIQRPSLLDE